APPHPAALRDFYRHGSAAFAQAPSPAATSRQITRLLTRRYGSFLIVTHATQTIAALNHFQHVVIVVVIDPHAARPTMIAEAEINDFAVEVEQGVIKLRHFLRLAYDVMRDQRTADAVFTHV